MKNQQKYKKLVVLPLFQLNEFFTRPFLVGLKGPCSEKAPWPTEEQPGPSRSKTNQNISDQFKNVLKIVGDNFHYLLKTLLLVIQD